MNISIIGTGYVGLVTGACFAELGANVICMDIDEEKINKLKQGNIPLWEEGLEEIVKRNYENGKLKFTSDIKETVQKSTVIFIAVGTPTVNNTADLGNVFDSARQIAYFMDGYKIIVNKSTVPIGTGAKVKEEINNILKQNSKEIEFDVVSNPEFLREGNAVKDFIKPDRIVIGTESQKAESIMKELYSVQILFGIPFIITNTETAEMIKYASNAFLATKISYINEIANMCELCNADVKVISHAMGLDNRIGSKFLNPGPGFGGSCFPKDTKALIGIGKSLGYEPQIVKSVVSVNKSQALRMIKKIEKILGNLEDKTITILGVAFKPDTDDIRETPAIPIIKELLKKNAKVKVYDPKANQNMKKFYPSLNIEYCKNISLACINSDCIVIVTEWDEFINIDFSRLLEVVKTPVICDLRNIYEPENVKKAGFVYQGVGRV